MALVTDAMSVWMERPRPSQPDKRIRESEARPSTKERWDYNTAGGLEGVELGGPGGSPSGKEDPDVMVLMEEEPG